jgi:hypothetical protein
MAGTPELFDRASIYNSAGLPSAPLFRRLTFSFRLHPSLFIVGAQKAGTTSLAEYLSEVPGIIGPWEKEIGFFNNDERYQKGENWYASFFSTRMMASSKTGVRSPLTFDASANYFEEPLAAKRIHSYDPKAKVVVLLRDPVQRAWSHYRMACRYGFEKRSFKDALSLEEQRIASHREGHNFAFQRLGYRTKGEYIRFLPEWKEVFGEQLHLIFSEELFSEPSVFLSALHAFIGLPGKPDVSKFLRHNKGNEEPVPKEERELLKDHFIPFNEQLAKYLNREIPW